jgi:hypothetical protein
MVRFIGIEGRFSVKKELVEGIIVGTSTVTSHFLHIFGFGKIESVRTDHDEIVPLVDLVGFVGRVHCRDSAIRGIDKQESTLPLTPGILLIPVGIRGESGIEEHNVQLGCDAHRTLQEIKLPGIDIETLSEIAAHNSNLQEGGAILMKTERIELRATQKIIGMKVSVILRSSIG